MFTSPPEVTRTAAVTAASRGWREHTAATIPIPEILERPWATEA